MAFIYIITNIQNGKQYIGQTSRSVDVRLSAHITGSSQCIGIVRAINKYGIENFHIECLEVSDKLVDLWEKHLIVNWNTKSPYGYNYTDGGKGRQGWCPSEETRNIWSKQRRGTKLSGKNPASRAIILIHPDGIEEQFDCLADAEKKYNLTQSKLTAVARGRRPHHKHFKARYLN